MALKTKAQASHGFLMLFRGAKLYKMADLDPVDDVRSSHLGVLPSVPW